MARKTVVTLVDDIDGKPADETVAFGLDGIGYEIDLRKSNVTKLRSVLEPYLAVARKAGTAPAGRKTIRGARTTRTTDRERSARIRAWAKTHELPVSERGRISAGL